MRNNMKGAKSKATLIIITTLVIGVALYIGYRTDTLCSIGSHCKMEHGIDPADIKPGDIWKFHERNRH